MPTLVCVPTPWPRESFLDFIEALWKREGFKHKAEMMRAANIDPSVHTNWGNGAQPTTDSLDKLARVLNVPATTLYVAAGRLSPGQLEGSPQDGQPILPREFQELTDLYLGANAPGRDLIRQQVSIIVRGLSAVLAEDPSEPRPKRRRTA